MQTPPAVNDGMNGLTTVVGVPEHDQTKPHRDATDPARLAPAAPTVSEPEPGGADVTAHEPQMPAGLPPGTQRVPERPLDSDRDVVPTDARGPREGRSSTRGIRLALAVSAVAVVVLAIVFSLASRNEEGDDTALADTATEGAGPAGTAEAAPEPATQASAESGDETSSEPSGESADETSSEPSDESADEGPSEPSDEPASVPASTEATPGLQLMGRVGDGFSSSSELADIDGAVVCTAGTATGATIASAALAADVDFTLNSFENLDIATQNFIDGACDLIGADGPNLAGRMATQQPNNEEWVILPRIPIPPGLQLMGRVSDGFSSSSELADIDGAVVCTNAGTATEATIASAALAADVDFTLNSFENLDIATQNFIDGACDLIAADGPNLAGRMATQQPNNEEWVIFPRIPIPPGLQLMGRVSDGFSSSSELADIEGTEVCTAGTATGATIVSAALAADVRNFNVNRFENLDIATQNFIDGDCDLMGADGATLAGRMATQQPNNEEWVIFPRIPIPPGLQLMGRVSDGFSSSSELADIDGAVVCTNAGTATEATIASAALAADVDFTLNSFENLDIATQNFIDGACDLIAADGPNLAGRMATQQPNNEWVIFPEFPIR